MALSALVVRTQTMHRAVDPVAYDCVRIVVIRDGRTVLFSEFGLCHVKVGDVVLLGAN
jgi:AraC family transcriptional regulator